MTVQAQLFADVADPLDDLSAWDVILVNTSAGKDSMASLDLVATAAAAQGVLDRVIVAHADLGRVEWKGVVDLAREQASRYGLRFYVSSAPGPDLLERVERRGMWPSPAMRWCTSDLKRGPIRKVMTKVVRGWQSVNGDRQVRLLNVMGLRAEESPARAKLPRVSLDTAASNSKREVTTFLPLHAWSVDDVWARIRSSRVSDLIHPAYGLGMPRLSCCFCIFAPKAALVTAARANPELADEYVRVEASTGHTFKTDLTMAEVVEAAKSGATLPDTEEWVG